MAIIPAVVFAMAGALFFLSRRVLKAPLPNRPWPLFDNKNAVWLDDATGQMLEGVYRTTPGEKFFGERAVVKWNSIKKNGQVRHYLCLYLEKHAGYMICRVKKLRNKILIKGYWCKQDKARTGEVRLIIHPVNGGYRLMHHLPLRKKILKIQGWYSRGHQPFARRLGMRYEKELQPLNGFQIIAHRGGGRNADFYPYSENTVEMIRLGALLGATGIEIDIGLTQDQVPVVFHDPVLSYRSMDNYFLITPLQNCSLKDLQAMKLKKGETIPTLRQAMDIILNETEVELVWWDVKYEGDLSPLQDLQNEYLQLAEQAGRRLKIYLGIASDATAKAFRQLAGHRQTPAITELDEATLHQLDADIWAPRWTEQLSCNEIESVQQKGKKVFVWTVDLADTLKKMVDDQCYDGILTNLPSLLAYYNYTRR